MSVLQVVLQQLGGPDRGMITRLAGIASEGRRNPGVDDLGDRRGAARPRGVEQACPKLEVVAPEEAVDPVVDGLTADLERLGDLLGGEPLGEPEHRLGATPPDLWPQLFSDVNCIALWISSEKILTRLYSVLHWFHKRLEANVKNPRENRCFQTVIVFSFGSFYNSNKCTVLWKIAAKLITVSTYVNKEMWVKLSPWPKGSGARGLPVPHTGEHSR